LILIEKESKYYQDISTFIKYESEFAVAAIDGKHPVMLSVGFLIQSVFSSTSSDKAMGLGVQGFCLHHVLR